VTGTETLIREALAAVADPQQADVERMWHEFQATAQATTQTRRPHNQWFIPLAAATATLLVMGLIVVGRAQLDSGRHEAPANPGIEFSLDRLPTWQNGASATAFPLPTPVSTPIAFDVAALTNNMPRPGHSRVVVYYADNPSRLCVIEIFRPTTGAEHTTSIACEGQSAYVNTPVSRGFGWILGTVPPAATRVKVTADGQPVNAEVVTRTGMPRPVFFAQFPESNTVGGTASVRWWFIDAGGRTVGEGPEAFPTTPIRPTNNPPYRATPVSEIATFDLPTQRSDPPGSRRILQIYYAGSSVGWCSKLHVTKSGGSGDPPTAAEDCGATAPTDRVIPSGAFLPASEYGNSFWGVMPPGATRTVVVVTDGKQIPVQTAQPTGMPNGVYAGSVAAGELDHPNPMYFLDAEGRVIAAASWRRFTRPPSCHEGVCTYDDGGQ